MMYCIGLALIGVLSFIIVRLNTISRFRERFTVLFYFKLHYIAAGFIIGATYPDSGVGLFERTLGPALMFCLVWIGLFFGIHLEYRKHTTITANTALIHFFGPLIVFACIGLIGMVYATYIESVGSFTDKVFFMSLLSMVTLFRRQKAEALDDEGHLYPVIADLPPERNLLPVLVMTLATSLIVAPETSGRLFGFSGSGSFLVITAAIGLCGGIVLSMILTDLHTRETTVISLIAVTAIVGGIADVFLVSPMLVGIIAGSVLINATTTRLQIIDGVFAAEDSIEKIFLALVGYLLAVVVFDDILLIGFFTLLALTVAGIRALVKYLIARLWLHRFHAVNKGDRLVWAALTGQGIVSVALVVEYMLRHQEAPHYSILFIGFIVFNQIITAAIAKARY